MYDTYRPMYTMYTMMVYTEYLVQYIQYYLGIHMRNRRRRSSEITAPAHVQYADPKIPDAYLPPHRLWISDVVHFARNIWTACALAQLLHL